MRKIIHIDMDCFYAAIEIRENMHLANKPVAVGGIADKRGVLTTCNYIARSYGVHSAMSTANALKLCSHLELLPVNMAKYKAVSEKINKIYKKYTQLVEPLSLDEAFLDVTNCQQYSGSATWIAEAIRQDIYQQESLTASAGVAPNKFLAKIASDWNKPNGLMVITPESINDFISHLPISKIFGVGKATKEKLDKLNIQTCADCQKLDLGILKALFGAFGQSLYQLCRGIDDRAVKPNRVKKSVSVEHTFSHDLQILEECFMHVEILHRSLMHRLEKNKQQITKQYVRIKFHDFTLTTHEQKSGSANLQLYKNLITYCFNQNHKKIRLIGLGVKLSEKQIYEAQTEIDFEALL